MMYIMALHSHKIELKSHRNVNSNASNCFSFRKVSTVQICSITYFLLLHKYILMTSEKKYILIYTATSMVL